MHVCYATVRIPTWYITFTYSIRPHDTASIEVPDMCLPNAIVLVWCYEYSILFVAKTTDRMHVCMSVCICT